MNRKLKYIAGKGASALPLSFFQKLTGKNVLFPAYHLVSAEQLPHIINLYQYKGPEEFVADIDWLGKNYQPLKLNELVTGKDSGFSKPSFFLSFDDGLRQVKEEAMPLLYKKGIPATIFINPAFVGNKKMMFRHRLSLIIQKWLEAPESLQREALIRLASEKQSSEKIPDKAVDRLLAVRSGEELEKLEVLLEVDTAHYLETERPYLDPEELEELSEKGFDIGAHSVNHPYYQHISFEEQKKETLDSLNFIETNKLSKIRSFAFPFYDDGISNELFEFFYSSANVDISFGSRGLKDDPLSFHFQRSFLDHPEMPASVNFYAEYLFYQIRAVIGKSNIKR